MDGALAASTKKLYLKHWEDFKSFMASLPNISHLPATEHSVALYVSYLHNQKELASSTIRTRLSAIAYFHKIQGLTNPTLSFVISKLLSSYSKNYTGNTLTRKPISHELLLKLLHVVKVYPLSSYEKHMFSALYVLMYEAALRVSEILYSKLNSHNLQIEQLRLNSKAVTIKFETYKHSQAASPKIVVAATRDIYCPVKLVKKYLSVRKPGPGPIFLGTNSKPITRTYLVKYLKFFLRVLNLNPKFYNSHSFRIGKATDLAMRGFSDSKIALVGRWKSNAFKKYLKPGFVLAN